MFSYRNANIWENKNCCKNACYYCFHCSLEFFKLFQTQLKKKKAFFGVSLVNTEAEKKRKDKHSFIIGIIKMYGNLMSCPGSSSVLLIFMNL